MKALATIVRFSSLKVACTRGAPPGKRSLARLAGFGAILVFAALVKPPFTATPNTESIATYAADCVTPLSTFQVGDTVCAVATDAPLGPPAQRLFEWVTPSGTIYQSIGPEITATPQSNSITIPAAGPVGTWQVKTVDRSNIGHTVARFVVVDQNNPAVDLWCPISAPVEVSAGSAAAFTVFVTNKGPNDAHNVQLTVTVATNSTFQSESQVSGPTFSCSDPPVDSSSGSSTCTIATLPASSPNNTAQFTFIFQVDAGATAGAVVSSTATVTNDTAEIFDTDNTFTASVSVSSSTCEVSCPGNVTDTTDPGQCGKVVTFTTPGGSGSGCGTVTCTPASGAFFPIGTTNVVCSGDTGGSCAFTVTIRDSGASISCPANITRNEDSGGLGFAVVFYAAPTFPDSCSASTAACNPPSGSSFPVGATTVLCEAINSSNTTLNCSFTVTVNSLSCVLICSDDVFAVENPSGSGSATVTYSSPTPSGCPSMTITCSPPSGSTFPLGTTTVNCSGTSGSNTLATCSFRVTVTQASPCTLTCPGNMAVTEDGNTNPYRGAVVTYAAPTTSNCPTVTVTCSPPSGTRFALGSTGVTCTATDSSNNTLANCGFTVTVNVISGVTLTFNNDPGQCGAIVNYTVPTNNCNSNLTCNPPSGDFFPVGTTPVDCIDNAATPCSFNFNVRVVDAEAPVFGNCPAVVRTTDPDHCSAVVNYAEPTVTDNCGLTLACVPPSGATFPKGSTTVTCTATDPANNTASCMFTVTVNDTQPPVIGSCPANISRSTDPNLCSAVVTYTTPTATDNCGVTVACSPPSGSVFAKGTTPVICRATDTSSNTSSCSFTVTVNDTQPPAISCPASITLEPTCPTGAIATYTAPVGTDNCPGAITARTAGLASGSVFPIGTTTVTYTVTDGVGLTASCSFTVTVKTAAAVIQDLINRVQLLQSQGKLSGQQAQGLNSKLQAALDAVNNGQTNVACNKLNDFISQVTAFINNGTLTSADGQPLINSAAHVRNTLGCTNLGCS